MNYLTILVALLPFVAFAGDEDLVPAERPGEPNVYGVTAEDAEMNAAILEARKTIADFKQRLANPPARQSYIALKARFEQDDISEHMWLSDIVVLESGFEGTLGNVPLELTNVRHGERVLVPLDRVSDWMAFDDGVLVGGYTLRVIRNRMSPAERAEFDAQFDIRID